MNVVSRDQWGARPPKKPYTALAGSQGIAGHHVGAGAVPPTTFDQAVARIRGTQNYHMDDQDWNDLAYGFMVGAGRVFEGRGWGWIDGADTGAGRLMHSVCWMGDSNDYDIPAADLAAIAWVIDEHQRRYGNLPVVGHGQINATDCPGDRLEAWLAAGRPVSKPAPPDPQPEQDDDDMKSIVGWDPRQDQWYHLFGNQAVRISDKAAGFLKAIGVGDIGQIHPEWLEGCRVTTGGIEAGS
jgi:hypothetical protein